MDLPLGIQMKTNNESIPVIDLFAGPGGLCEGFSSIFDEAGARRFNVKVSIEKDPVAHSTLMLRAIFRRFPKGKAPDAYYDYVRGSMSRAEFLSHPDIRDAAKHAANEARCAELGKTPPEQIDTWIASAVKGASDWVLIGGPPCQAYSLAGRSRLRPKDREAFEADSKHFLYTEYLRIIQRFEPTVFVMENVKGMLNSRNSGARIFERILADLSKPKQGLSYRIRSLAVDKEELEPEDFVVEADDHGVPQSRHRVFLFGVREDVAARIPALRTHASRFVLRKAEQKVGMGLALEGLPALRSRLSQEGDSHAAWLDALREATGVPLVLHGGSGVRREHVLEGITRGIAKVNIGTEIRQAYEQAWRAHNSIEAGQEATYTRTCWVIRDYFGIEGTRHKLL